MNSGHSLAAVTLVVGTLELGGCPSAVEVDIKPGSCPNSFNLGSHGVLPVALMGTPDFDVTQVDLSTLLIERNDGVGGAVAPNEGPPGPHTVFEDIATPFFSTLLLERDDGVGGAVAPNKGPPGPLTVFEDIPTPFYGEDSCDCHDLNGDGIVDLSMKFRSDDLVAELELEDSPGGSMLEMIVTGNLIDGTSFMGGDCILIVPPGDQSVVSTFIQSNVPDTFIQTTPLDLNIDGDGFADFDRSYYSGTALTLTAPARSDGRRFVRWSVNGVLQEIGVRTLEAVIEADMSLRAIYQHRRSPAPQGPKEHDLAWE